MLREATPVKLAEKVLLLTHSLLAAARREDWDDFNETMRLREAAIASLGARPLDAEARELLAKAQSAEAAIERSVKDAQGELVAEMAGAYRSRRGLARYDAACGQGGLLDSQS